MGWSEASRRPWRAFDGNGELILFPAKAEELRVRRVQVVGKLLLELQCLLDLWRRHV
jgi:hypothetical protein